MTKKDTTTVILIVLAVVLLFTAERSGFAPYETEWGEYHIVGERQPAEGFRTDGRRHPEEQTWATIDNGTPLTFFARDKRDGACCSWPGPEIWGDITNLDISQQEEVTLQIVANIHEGDLFEGKGANNNIKLVGDNYVEDIFQFSHWFNPCSVCMPPEDRGLTTPQIQIKITRINNNTYKIGTYEFETDHLSFGNLKYVEKQIELTGTGPYYLRFTAAANPVDVYSESSSRLEIYSLEATEYVPVTTTIETTEITTTVEPTTETTEITTETTIEEDREEKPPSIRLLVLIFLISGIIAYAIFEIGPDRGFFRK